MATAHETQSERTSVVEHGFRRFAIVAGVMLAALMQTLDSTITNVALPTIQGNLGASSDEGTWVINGYTIAVVIVIPIIPWLQTVLGRKRYILISVAGFTLFSFLCGISTSIDELIVFRVIQGVFGAGLLATGQSIIRDTFDESQLGLSQAIFALGAVGGPALGPPIGGLLVDNVSWNWIFEINVPIGIASFLILANLLRDPQKASKKSLDVIGLLLLMVGVGAFQYLLSEGERYDWLSDPNITLCAVLAVGGILGLILWESFGARVPIVDIAIFRYRSLSAGVAIALIVGAALLGTQYVLPQYVQQSLGFTATLSGLLVLVKALPIALLTLLVAPLVTKFDARIFMAIGFGLTALSCFWQGIVTTGLSEFGTFVGSLIIGGAGVALIYVPVSVAVLGAVPRERGGSATSWINLAVQLGGSISIALLSTIIDRRSAFHLTALAGSVAPSNAHLSAIPTVSQLSNLAQSVTHEAVVLAYADSSFAVALLAAVAIPVVFIMRKPRTGGTVEIGARRRRGERAPAPAGLSSFTFEGRSMTTRARQWWTDRSAVERFVGDLLAGEFARIRPGRSLPALPWPASLPLDESGLGADSLDRLKLATALGEAIHLHRSGIDDSLLAEPTFGRWVDTTVRSLERFSHEVTFRTSGSTGSPRWYVHQTRDLNAEIEVHAARFAGCGRLIAVVPSDHIYGFLFTLLLPARLGAGVIDVRGSSPARLASLLQPGDLVIGHPLFWAAFVRAVPRVDPGVRAVTSTAPCPADVARAVVATGIESLVEVYGSSETAGVGWRDDPGMPYTLFPMWRRAQRPSELARVAGGKQEPLLVPDRLDWIDDHHFYPGGRHEGAVQVGGQNVLPERVRSVVRAHPDVADAAVRLMRPEEGDRLKAFVLPRDPAADRPALRAALWTWLESQLTASERPTSIEFGDVLPVSRLGKNADWPIERDEAST